MKQQASLFFMTPNRPTAFGLFLGCGFLHPAHSLWPRNSAKRALSFTKRNSNGVFEPENTFPKTPTSLFGRFSYGLVPVNICEIVGHRRVTNGYRIQAKHSASGNVDEFRASELAKTAAGLLQEYACSRNVVAFAKYCSPMIREELERVEKAPAEANTKLAKAQSAKGKKKQNKKKKNSHSEAS